MKSPFKVLVSILALGVMAAGPLLRAADENAPAGETPKGGRGGRGGMGGRAGMMNVDEEISRIETGVGSLSTEQKTRIKEIFAKSREQMQALRDGGNGDRQAARGKGQEILKANRDQVRALLTADQQKKFDELPMPARGGPGGPGGPGAGRGEGRKKGN